MLLIKAIVQGLERVPLKGVFLPLLGPHSRYEGGAGSLPGELCPAWFQQEADIHRAGLMERGSDHHGAPVPTARAKTVSFHPNSRCA